VLATLAQSMVVFLARAGDMRCSAVVLGWVENLDEAVGEIRADTTSACLTADFAGQHNQ